jgi:Domain of unknown function (DUF4082)
MWIAARPAALPGKLGRGVGIPQRGGPAAGGRLVGGGVTRSLILRNGTPIVDTVLLRQFSPFSEDAIMKRFLALAAAVLSLGACGDTGGKSLLEPDAEPSFAPGDVWTMFPTQTPASTLTFTDGPWEVATQFYVTKEVCVLYLRFWRAAGETGTNRIKLWTNTGSLIVARNVTSSGTGWQDAYVSSIVCLQPYTYYRVSVNTNTAQVKTFGAFSGGPITNGPMVATSGYYGQTGGAMPTTQSSSNFFVDLVVAES